jgi:hypothetical protein
MIALLIKSGIARAEGSDVAKIMIACLAAAMLHDFEHPQLNNHFLVETVSPRPLSRQYLCGCGCSWEGIVPD